MSQQRLERIQTQQVAPGNVRVVVHLVAVDVVLHDVLVNPVQRAASDPVLARAEHAVHPGVARDGAVVGVVLDVEADEGHQPAEQGAQVPLVRLVRVDVHLERDGRREDAGHFEVVVPRGERLGAGQDLLHNGAQLEVVGVAARTLGGRLLARRVLGHARVGKLAAVVG